MKKVDKYYRNMLRDVKKLKELNPGRSVSLGTQYYDDSESLNLYKEMIKLIESKQKLTRLDYNLGIITEDKAYSILDDLMIIKNYSLSRIRILGRVAK